jgi:hypothetical protein
MNAELLELKVGMVNGQGVVRGQVLVTVKVRVVFESTETSPKLKDVGDTEHTGAWPDLL